ncbi:MAG: flagellin FliC [Candidatus Dadabacteria bacterium]|nr:MAG: flagellin FliC [Candidatus Dadabacteria bacterium]
MTLSLSFNIASLRAQTQLKKTNQELSKTFERLSSGLRINRASDDPAGLALADALRADTKIATVAIRNANDGISLTNIADSALEEISNILNRMAELAEQSANGAVTNSQRSALSSEFTALASEIERIAKTTEFNDLKLLSNSSDVSIQVGLDGTSNSVITINSVLGTLNSLNLGDSGGILIYSVIDSTTALSQTAAQNALSAVNNAITTLGITRGLLGASQSRLEFAVNNLTVARENFAAAESAIRDADIAQEVANMVRLQVLQQSVTAVLAQANLQPQLVLKLLQ